MDRFTEIRGHECEKAGSLALLFSQSEIPAIAVVHKSTSTIRQRLYDELGLVLDDKTITFLAATQRILSFFVLGDVFHDGDRALLAIKLDSSPGDDRIAY